MSEFMSMNEMGGSAQRDGAAQLSRGNFAPVAEKIRNEGLPELLLRQFQHYYQQLVQGATGYIDGSEAQPVQSIPHMEELENVADAGRAALQQTVMLKLNGGLGTSMGMSGPKSLLPVKDDLTFFDIIARQVLHLRKEYDTELPLVFMNSFNTDADTRSALDQYPALSQDVAQTFLQHKVPKVRVDTLEPVDWPADPDKEWCPPGHGDLYAALQTADMLEALLEQGYQYMFVSNSDNLGATLDLDILGYFAREELPFLMEVARRTPADRKGGHLAQRSNGQLILREVAQCPPEELDAFQDVDRYRYFNTNNLWINLRALQRMLNEHDGIIHLPLIRNQKTVDPTDPESPAVYQLETAMGSAIGVFPRAQAICVPRSRFVPVKRTNDLLLLQSDVYQLAEDYSVKATVDPLPLVDLDDRYYKLIDDLTARFPYGAPSLRRCTHLRVLGDIRFGEDVVLVGEVEACNEDETQQEFAA